MSWGEDNRKNPTLQGDIASPLPANIRDRLEQGLLALRPPLAAVASFDKLRMRGFLHAQLGTPFGQGIAERREVDTTPLPLFFGQFFVSFQALRCHVRSSSLRGYGDPDTLYRAKGEAAPLLGFTQRRRGSQRSRRRSGLPNPFVLSLSVPKATEGQPPFCFCR
jgi:hypothetical protein